MPKVTSCFWKSPLIEVAARVVEMKTMIEIHLPTTYPAQDVLCLALTRIPRLVA